MNHTEDWVIEAENLSYSYEENDRKALDGLSVRIGRGKKVAFMGGNGSGKSTFFLCLNGILRPDKGRVLIDGKRFSYGTPRNVNPRLYGSESGYGGRDRPEGSGTGDPGVGYYAF